MSPIPPAPIDCFYVYPTVSLENTPNADMASGPEERRVCRVPICILRAKCRTFAPLYRQITVASLNGAVSGADFQLPYRDVLEAWRFYLAHENQGRGAVLIGHSQGAKILTRLLAEEVDGRPVQRLLISAILPGTDIQMPRNSHASGTFHHIPACATRSQIGCIIAYSTYLASDPPGPDSAFGASAGQGLSDACVNPGALIADGTLDTRLPTRGEVANPLRHDLCRKSRAHIRHVHNHQQPNDPDGDDQDKRYWGRRLDSSPDCIGCSKAHVGASCAGCKSWPWRSGRHRRPAGAGVVVQEIDDGESPRKGDTEARGGVGAQPGRR